MTNMPRPKSLHTWSRIKKNGGKGWKTYAKMAPQSPPCCLACANPPSSSWKHLENLPGTKLLCSYETQALFMFAAGHSFGVFLYIVSAVAFNALRRDLMKGWPTQRLQCRKQAMHVQTKMFRQQPRLAFSTTENALIVRWNALCFEQILLLPSQKTLNVRPQGLLPRETGLGCDLRSSHYLDRGPWSASLLSKGVVLLYRLQWSRRAKPFYWHSLSTRSHKQ